jgi:hypothetical protein
MKERVMRARAITKRKRATGQEREKRTSALRRNVPRTLAGASGRTPRLRYAPAAFPEIRVNRPLPPPA